MANLIVNHCLPTPMAIRYYQLEMVVMKHSITLKNLSGVIQLDKASACITEVYL